MSSFESSHLTASKRKTFSSSPNFSRHFDTELKRTMFKATSTLKQTSCGLPQQTCTKTSATSHHCLKCFLAKRLWMVSVNMYDIMGLLDICPCGTLHSIRPYISYKIKNK